MSNGFPNEQQNGGPRGSPGAGGGGSTGRRKAAPSARWSYTLQDIPSMVGTYINDINKGYAVRLGLACAAVASVSYAAYYVVVVRNQEHKPYAQRWYPPLFHPSIPLTLLERKREKNSDMEVFVFQFPNSFDYAGYDPVSSVMISSGRVRNLESVSRLYTPITHPKQRGTIAFAIKDCDPGRMCGRLRYLALGDKVYMGRWYKEFDYNAYKRGVEQSRKSATHSIDSTGGRELGLVCTTGGASVALQLMTILDKDKQDSTRLKFLYCHHTAKDIPFESVFERFQRRNPDRISVFYDVQSLAKRSAEEAQEDKKLQERIDTALSSLGGGHSGKATAAITRTAGSSGDATTTGGTSSLVSWLWKPFRRSGAAKGGSATSTSVEETKAALIQEMTREEEARRTDGGKLLKSRVRLGENFFIGNIDPSIVQRVLPPPVAMDPVTQEPYRPMILVCGPQSMLSPLCGRTSPLGHKGYWRGPFYKYGGFMKDMGYTRSQVYKFGVSTHALAYQY